MYRDRPYKNIYGKRSVQARTTDRYTPQVQWLLTSVGLAQARPNNNHCIYKLGCIKLNSYLYPYWQLLGEVGGVPVGMEKVDHIII